MDLSHRVCWGDHAKSQLLVQRTFNVPKKVLKNYVVINTQRFLLPSVKYLHDKGSKVIPFNVSKAAVVLYYSW